MSTENAVSDVVLSGLPALDNLVQGLRFGDNVVWQVDRLEDYPMVVRPYMEQAVRDNRVCVYLRFAPHPMVLTPQPGLDIIEIDPSPGFDYFTGQVHHVIEKYGKRAFYVFDNLSALVEEWATDELLNNFFKATCPYLYTIEAVAYFALRRGQHGHRAISGIRNTTQVLIDIYHVAGDTYIQPLKASGRYSQQMFLPHRMTDEGWEPVSRSGDAAKILATAVKKPLGTNPESIAPWDDVYRKLLQNREGNEAGDDIDRETQVLKESLSRMMVGNHWKLIQLANRYMTLNDLLHIRDRLIGSGRIGGKAAGMLLARSVLQSGEGATDLTKVLDEHDSFYVGSDVFFTFLVNNDLFKARLELTRSGTISRDEFERLEEKFLAGTFPEEIMEQFRGMIDYYGQAPIIVRSSSLLEDGFTDAFAGKYRSEFCTNQGSPDERLDAFLTAIRQVYASALNPDALAYRHRRGLGEGDEQMAVLVQRVSGMPYKKYFFPTLAGVAFSRNLYAWTDRIDPQKGMIRLVFGLGTRAVNRVTGDYPRMIAVSHPKIRPETGMEVARYSQKMVDALNLDDNTFVTEPFTTIIKGNNYPALELYTSEISEGYLRDWFVKSPESSGDNLVLTFNNMIHQTKLIETIGEMVARLEQAWGQPVDVEFTAHIDEGNTIRVNLLQCRSLRVPTLAGSDVTIPEELDTRQILFRSNRAINAGMIRNIGYIIYIDPKEYAEAQHADARRTLGRIVGMLNNRLETSDCKIMMMGPGRWGSNNIDLGINVGYSEIDNTSILVEIAREKAGHTPEVSYGTHFFQDLVESNILYLPVYPDEPGSDFNTGFFSSSPNALEEVLPDAGDFSGLVRVIDVAKATGGKTANVIADPQTRKAVCYLEINENSEFDTGERGYNNESTET